jgi:hypothetical protein
MPKTKTSTGIFETESKTIRGRTAIKRAFEKFFERGTLEAMVSEYERAARRILQAHGITPHRIPAEVDSIVWDAEIVLCHVEGIRRYVAEGNTEAAAVAALALGREGLRLQVRPHEKSARVGRAGLENLRKGWENGTDRYSEARERHRIWSEEAAKMDGSISSKANRIARKHNDDPETKPAEEWKPATIRKFLENSRKIRA